MHPPNTAFTKSEVQEEQENETTILRYRKLSFLAVFVSICASLQVFKDYFIYWQDDLFHDFWRLWTAHGLTSVGFFFVLNILAFICLPFIFPRVFDMAFCCHFIDFISLISLSFYFFFTRVLKPMPDYLVLYMVPMSRWLLCAFDV